MSSTNRTDLVGEYLQEVERRLAGLPMLQRRELLTDLEAHIAEARVTASSDGEMIEVLERLGSPEDIAAAAYAEAGAPPLAAPPPLLVGPPVRGRSRGIPGWVIALIIGVVVVVLLLCTGALFFTRSATSEPAPAIPVPVQTQ